MLNSLGYLYPVLISVPFRLAAEEKWLKKEREEREERERETEGSTIGPEREEKEKCTKGGRNILKKNIKAGSKYRQNMAYISVLCTTISYNLPFQSHIILIS